MWKQPNWTKIIIVRNLRCSWLANWLTSSRILTVVPELEGWTLVTENCACLYNPTPLLSNSHWCLISVKSSLLKWIPQQNVEACVSCLFSPSYMYFLPWPPYLCVFLLQCLWTTFALAGVSRSSEVNNPGFEHVNESHRTRVEVDRYKAGGHSLLGWDETSVLLVRRSLFGLLHQPRMIDDERGTVDGMRIGGGHGRTRRKPIPLSLCPPQISHDLTWNRTWGAAVESWRLTSWAMIRSGGHKQVH
jgi:hypothetical protein